MIYESINLIAATLMVHQSHTKQYIDFDIEIIAMFCILFIMWRCIQKMHITPEYTVKKTFFQESF